MLADLVEVMTPEGISLSGAYFAPKDVSRPTSIDAILFFHGDGGHFYSNLYLGLGQRMAEQGIAFLTANRRGHDHVSSGVRGGPLAGYAFESVDDSRADFRCMAEPAARTRTLPHCHRGAQRWSRPRHLRAGN